MNNPQSGGFSCPCTPGRPADHCRQQNISSIAHFGFVGLLLLLKFSQHIPAVNPGQSAQPVFHCNLALQNLEKKKGLVCFLGVKHVCCRCLHIEKKRQNLLSAFPKPIKMRATVKANPVEAIFILLKRQLRKRGHATTARMKQTL